jgi:hypothetical protein
VPRRKKKYSWKSTLISIVPREAVVAVVVAIEAIALIAVAVEVVVVLDLVPMVPQQSMSTTSAPSHRFLKSNNGLVS